MKNPEENIIFTGSLKVDYNGKGNGYSISMFNRNTGQFVKVAENRPATYVRQAIKTVLDGHIQERYTVPALSYTQQVKQQNYESE